MHLMLKGRILWAWDPERMAPLEYVKRKKKCIRPWGTDSVEQKKGDWRCVFLAHWCS